MGYQFFLPMVLRWRASRAEAPLLLFHIWLKTQWITSPKEHEKKRWKTRRRRAEEIACFGKNNEGNKSEAMESKSSLYIFRKSRFFDQAKGPCGRNPRNRFELCLMAARFGAQMKRGH